VTTKLDIYVFIIITG